MQAPLPPGPPRVGKNPLALLRYLLRGGLVQMVAERFATYGDLYYAPLGNVELMVTRHPKHIREILQSQGSKFIKTEKGVGARQLRRFLGTGLLNSNGDFWRKNANQRATQGRDTIAALQSPLRW